ncbi:54S ribosomal protein yml6, mitochondrial [Tilletia horrida]|nr:54S ribosomal protein yml6, mitochondrial [Tilletia horrida]
MLRRVVARRAVAEAARAARPSTVAGPSVAASPSCSSSATRFLQTGPSLDPASAAGAGVPELPLSPRPSAISAEQSARDANFLRQISIDPLVHVPLCYLHPSTKGAEFPAKSYVPLSSHVFGTAPRSDVLHSAVVYYLDSLRAGTASTKTRGEVAYSGRKLRPQKGSGRARLGTRGNPLLKGGGVAHGPKPRDFSTKLPRRVRELALRSALSARWRNNDLHVIPSFGGVDPPPRITGPMRRLLGSKGWDRALFLTAPRSPKPPARALITNARPSAADPVYSNNQLKKHEQLIENFKKAVGNIPNTEVLELHKLPEEAVRRMLQRKGRKAALEVAKRPGELHAYQVLLYPKLICDLGAIEWLEEKLGGAGWHNIELEALDELGDAGTAVMAASSATPQGDEEVTTSTATSEDEDFVNGASTTISELGETDAEKVQGDDAAAAEAPLEATPEEEAQLEREADEILKQAGVEPKQR